MTDPAGTFAPQLAHRIVAPVMLDPIVAVEGIAPVPGEDPGIIVGFQTRARMPPINPNKNPMKKPPTAKTQLKSESTRTTAPHFFMLAGLRCIITPPTIMINPKITPTTPKTVTVEPALPPFAKYPKVPEI